MLTIRIINSKESELFSGLVTDLPLKEEYIIAKSIERFNENEPCIIYRTHVSKIFYLELYDKLTTLYKRGVNKILSSDFSDFFDNINLDTKGAYILIS